MKKEINSKSRRKWIMGGLAAFASVALLTTGFAVWIVGANKTIDKGDVGVKVDTAKNESVVFNFNLAADAGIELKENGAKSGKMVHTDGIDDTNSYPLRISYTGGTIQYGAGYDFKFKSIVFSIQDPSEMKDGENVAADAGDYASVKVSAGNKLTGGYARTGSDFTYLTAPKAIAIPEQVKATSGTTTITINKGTLDFGWGTFYNIDTTSYSPADFYNETFKTADDNDVAAHSDEVEQEYADLYNAFVKELNKDGTVKTWKKLKLVATLSTDEVRFR